MALVIGVVASARLFLSCAWVVAAAKTNGRALLCSAVCDCGGEGHFDRREKVQKFLQVHRRHMPQWKNLTPDSLSWSMHEDPRKARVRGPRRESCDRLLGPRTPVQLLEGPEVGLICHRRFHQVFCKCSCSKCPHLLQAQSESASMLACTRTTACVGVEKLHCLTLRQRVRFHQQYQQYIGGVVLGRTEALWRLGACRCLLTWKRFWTIWTSTLPGRGVSRLCSSSSGELVPGTSLPPTD